MVSSSGALLRNTSENITRRSRRLVLPDALLAELSRIRSPLMRAQCPAAAVYGESRLFSAGTVFSAGTAGAPHVVCAGRPSWFGATHCPAGEAPGQAQNIFVLEDVPLSPRATTVVEQGLPSARNLELAVAHLVSKKVILSLPQAERKRQGHLQRRRDRRRSLRGTRWGSTPLTQRHQRPRHPSCGQTTGPSQHPKGPPNGPPPPTVAASSSTTATTVPEAPSSTSAAGSGAPKAPTGGSCGTEVSESDGGQGGQVPRSPDEVLRDSPGPKTFYPPPRKGTENDPGPKATTPRKNVVLIFLVSRGNCAPRKRGRRVPRLAPV